MEAQTLNEVIRYNVEAVYGETPDSEAMKALVLKNGPAFNVVKTNYESKDVGQGERMQRHSIETGRRWTGELVADFSMDLFTFLRDQVMRGTVVELLEDGTTLNGPANLNAIDSRIEFNSTADFEAFQGVKLIKVSGSATAANDGTYRVVSADSMGEFLQIEDGVLDSADDSLTTQGLTFSGNYVRNGTEASQGIHFERGFTDISEYESFIGGILNSLAISIPAETELTLTASLIGQDVITSGASKAATVEDPTSEIPISACSVPGKLYADGSEIGALSSVNFTIANNLRDKPVIGSCFGLKRGDGYTDVSGTMEVYTENNDLFNKYIAHTDLSLEIHLTGSDGRQAIIYIPRIKQSDNNKGSPASNSDVMQSVSWKAFRPANLSFSIQIDII